MTKKENSSLSRTIADKNGLIQVLLLIGLVGLAIFSIRLSAPWHLMTFAGGGILLFIVSVLVSSISMRQEIIN